MKKTSNRLFTLFIAISFGFFIIINSLRNSSYLEKLDDLSVLLISSMVITLIIIVFVFRELENRKIQNEFITIVTHKFKTPLTGIRWTINMLQKDITLVEKKELLEEMQKANDRIMEIVDLLVGFAKFDKKLEYAFVDTSFMEIIGFSISKYSAALKLKDIKLSENFDGDLPKVAVDKIKMQFVVDMLIDNAIKYTPKGGSITVSATSDSKFVTIKIIDTGIGFGYFDSLRIFKHFFRSYNAKKMDTEGLGLGLYTAKMIVKHHSGKLWAESKGTNKGSTFYLKLPIKR